MIERPNADRRFSPASLSQTFGPLAAIATFETEEEAIRMANDSSVGLGSYLFTENVGRAWRVAEAIEAGMVAVNHGEKSRRWGTSTSLL